ncbi:MAG TPA: hypothetical protein VIK18_23660 [Pirellulales bacterium]
MPLSRLLRFRLRTILVAVALVGVWLGWETGRVRKKARAIAVVRNAGGAVFFDYQRTRPKGWNTPPEAPGFRWLKWALGEDYAANVIEVQVFSGLGKSPAAITDSDMDTLAAGLGEVEWLVLMDTSITDAGLVPLRRLRELQRLDLEGTLVTKAGVDALRKSLPGTKIWWDGSLDE